MRTAPYTVPLIVAVLCAIGAAVAFATEAWLAGLAFLAGVVGFGSICMEVGRRADGR
jgi:hypothetical protein